jgi:hypothetical protein
LKQTLIQAGNSTDPMERELCARALGEAGHAPDETIMQTLMCDNAPQVRAAAARAAATLDDTQRVPLLYAKMSASTRRRFLNACRHTMTPALCEHLLKAASIDAEAKPDLIKTLHAANWRAPKTLHPLLDRCIEREILHVDTALKLLDDLASCPQHDSSAARQLLQALRVEIRNGCMQLLNLLGLLYDPRLMRRVGHVLQGQLTGDKSLAIESLDVALDAQHRKAVVRVMESAFDIEPPVRSASPKKSDSTCVAEILRLAHDCRWADHPDWLQACALAFLRELGANADQLSKVEPLGPVSDELMRQNFSRVIARRYSIPVE